MNADDVDVLDVQDDLYDKNPYVYCDNNSVIRKDEDGNAWELAVAGGGVLSTGTGGLGASIVAGAGTITPMGWILIGITVTIVAASVVYSKVKSKSKRDSRKKGKAQAKNEPSAKPRSKYPPGKRYKYKIRKSAKQATQRAAIKNNRKIENHKHPNSKNTQPHFQLSNTHTHYFYPRRFGKY